MTQINASILGRGRAGQAIQFALGVLHQMEPDLQIGDIQFLSRGSEPSGSLDDIFCLANPNALHASQIVKANQRGMRWIVSEKPICVSREELDLLSQIQGQVAVLHVYRQMWGPRTIRKLIESGEVGTVVNIEGRYWHSSVAEAFVRAKTQKTSAWKNDPALCGPYDVLLDVGTHWLDLACYFLNEVPQKNRISLSYQAAEKPHRDTHMVIDSIFKSGVEAFASISKIAHGYSDHLEVNVIGTKKMLKWTFTKPDEISVGEGRRQSTLVRETTELGSHMAPFRSTGWLEGYIEILRQFLYHKVGKKFEAYPDLKSVLPVMRSIFDAEIRKR
jgi:predicted dehydrogenase